MQNLLNDLTDLLSQDDRLVAEGKLLKNKVIELALAMDSGLIKLLLKNSGIKKHFFTEVDGILVFDKIKFQRFVSNKEFLPDSYTAFKNKIGLVDEQGEYITNKQDVVLAWPYKDCVLEGGQTKEDQKRDEIFWNETLAPDEIDRLLAPKVFTGWKKYDSEGEHELTGKEKIDFQKENLIIRGNNLLALHSLVKQYAGKVKLIYIDPPYNRDADTFYNDSFKRSSWLTFMKNRLEVAKSLLGEDGVIFIQIDDTQHPYLKVLCDEIFDEKNNPVTIYVQVRYDQKTLSEKNDFQKVIEQIIVYQKSKFKPIKEKDEYTIDKFCWKIIEKGKGQKVKINEKDVTIFKEGEYEIKKIEPSLKGLKETWASGSVLKSNASGKFFNDYLSKRVATDGLGVLYKVEGIGEDGLGFRYFTGPKKEGATKGKFYSGIPLNRINELKNGKSERELVIPNFYDFAADFGNCRQEGGVELRSGKKPEILLKKIIDMVISDKKDIILDFFMGTGVSVAVAHKMGIRYFGIEQLDYGDNDARNRLINVINNDQTGISKSVNWQGGGSFIYCELAEWNEAYISKIQKAKTTKELLSIWKDMQEKAFISYKVDPKAINENISDFEKLSLDEQKRFLIETLDKNQLYVNYSEIDDEDYKISDTDKKLNKMFYGEV